MCISSSGLDLKDTLINGQQGHIKGSSSKIKNQHISLLVSLALLVQTIGNSGSCWLVNNTKHLESSNHTGILGCLSLRIIEVGWHSHHSLLHLSSKVGLCHLLHLSKDHGRDFLWRECLLFVLVGHLDHWLVSSTLDHLEWPVAHIMLDSWLIKLASNQTLGIEHRVVWVESHLILGSISYQTLGVSEGNVRWGSSVTLLIWNNLHSVILPHSNTGVGCSQINSYSFNHCCYQSSINI
mmetsp:Transcript_10425/g.20611  ORF Transcript_10425/g.20611 Transcript_10425/m.20611 type:complete len:238 (+) Transcript_10425:267-980(+)